MSRSTFRPAALLAAMALALMLASTPDEQPPDAASAVDTVDAAAEVAPDATADAPLDAEPADAPADTPPDQTLPTVLSGGGIGVWRSRAAARTPRLTPPIGRHSLAPLTAGMVQVGSDKTLARWCDGALGH